METRQMETMDKMKRKLKHLLKLKLKRKLQDSRLKLKHKQLLLKRQSAKNKKKKNVVARKKNVSVSRWKNVRDKSAKWRSREFNNSVFSSNRRWSAKCKKNKTGSS